MFHQFARSYAVTPQCYHIHLILIINNAQLTIYVLQGFQSLLHLPEKHCSNLLLFSLSCEEENDPRSDLTLTELCCARSALSQYLHSPAGKFQPLHQITFFNCINLRDSIGLKKKQTREGITSIMNEESVTPGLSWSSSNQLSLRPCIFWDSCLKFTFLNASLPLILLCQFFIHKVIRSL